MHAVPALGEVRLSELSPLHFQRLYGSLLSPERHLSAGTVLNLHLVLTQALGQAVRWGICSSNPVKGAQPPRPVRPEPVVVDQVLARRIVAALRGSVIEAPGMFAISTGMRRGEILGPESFFLAFLVGLHVATATALLIYFWSDWRVIIGGFFRTLGEGARERKAPWKVIRAPNERMAWLLVVATIPAGITGLAFEHLFRVTFAKPLYAAVFLMVNGVILLVGERFRRRTEVKAIAATHGTYEGTEYRRLDTLEFKEAVIIGVAQVFALIAGVSRSGITMVAGLVRGLSHEDAARFSFLLATPIILAAGVYKLPELFGPLGNGIRMQVLVGSIAAGFAAYLSVRFLMNYFETRTLTPFAAFCLLEGPPARSGSSSPIIGSNQVSLCVTGRASPAPQGEDRLQGPPVRRRR